MRLVDKFADWGGLPYANLVRLRAIARETITLSWPLIEAVARLLQAERRLEGQVIDRYLRTHARVLYEPPPAELLAEGTP
jgi:hypothetical protein